ncbi:MAG: lysophospholipid acyltransferase family protein [Nitriliruptoraceae bacterium]
MSALYRVGSALFLGGFRTLGVDLRVHGADRIPASGPVVLASNHIGYLDFAFVMLAPPAPRREVRFLARDDFFHNPVLGFLLRRLGQIPVDVHGDPMQAAAAAQACLEDGEIVGIHPEGTISPSFVPRRGKTGVVRLADSVEAPIVPVALWGSQRLLTKARRFRPQRGTAVVVRYGEPFRPTARTSMLRTQQVMERITAELTRAQASYPQRPGPPPHDWWQPAHLGGSAPTPEAADAAIAAQNAARRERRAQRGALPGDGPGPDHRADGVA